jgi:phospholipid/cholesterol/gamma-HCH transport system substrate-binding protein
MRSRTIREGSVGLLILLGFAVLGGLFLWLQGLNPGQRSYQTTVRFANAEGMQVGAPVRYRGVVAGKISAIRVSANYAEIDIRITPATIIIPKNVTIESKQSGLVGETFIDITPNTQLTGTEATGNPLSSKCNEELIICDGSYLQGTTSVTLTELLGSVIRFTNLFSSPEFFANVQTLTKNFASAAEGVDNLAGEVTVLSKSVRSELGTLSDSTSASANSIGSAADQIGLTANQFGLTATELQSLIATNRTTLVSTLDSLNQTVQGVESIVSTLAPAIEEGDFVTNLQTLSANAAEASANLRNFSSVVGTSENILLLQQTLDSARATFQNAQKITSDLDELTGDPAFRENIQRLVNGLGGLVSSAEELHQQTQLAQMLAPAEMALEVTQTATPTLTAPTQRETQQEPKGTQPTSPASRTPQPQHEVNSRSPKKPQPEPQLEPDSAQSPLQKPVQIQNLSELDRLIQSELESNRN